MIHIGTSGFSYPHWKEVFYPKNVKDREFLEYYATKFNTVELNVSFYRLPNETVISGWKKRVPKNFFFCPKLSRYITHVKRLNDVKEPLQLFLKRFGSLKSKLGPILVQLPPKLKFDSPQVLPFLKLLKKYKSYKFALEARDESWICQKAMKNLEENNIIWVIADSGGRYPSLVSTTAKHVYFRFHGPAGLYSSKYPKKILTKYANIAKKWLQDGKDIWAYFNNDAQGYAVQNALEFEKLIEKH